MSDRKQKGLVPRLRFPEFRDAGPWEYEKLGPYLEQYTERIEAVGCDLPVYSSSRDGLRLQKDYFDGRELLNKGEYGVVPIGYFVYRHMSDDTTFKFNINDTGRRIAVSKEYPVFNTLNLHSRFLLYLLNDGTDFKRFAESQRKGGTRTRLYFKTLCSCKLPFPSLPEQQKIADCLSSLDEVIELDAKRLKALKAHKKGLMQQFFPRQGETTPRLRFPEFRDAGPWEVRRLGDLSVRIVERVGDKSLIPVSITAGQGFVSQAEKFGRDISGKQYKNYIRLRKGQFAYNKGNSKPFPQGAIYQLVEFEEVAVPNAFYSFKFKRDYVPEFYKGYFESNFHGRQLAKFITSGARSDGLLNISANDFFSIVLPTPVEKDEQQKIADCLSSLDEVIELQTKKLEALKAHKKGLMQQLFPQEVG